MCWNVEYIPFSAPSPILCSVILTYEILVVPREKTPTGAAAGGNPGDAPVLAS